MLAVLILICSPPLEKLRDTKANQTDVVEVNTFNDLAYSKDKWLKEQKYEEREVFTQVIWWNWDYTKNEWVVRDWRLLTLCGWPEKIRGVYIVIWYDEKVRPNVWRQVRSKEMWRSHSFYDPELVNREILPEGLRDKFK